MKSEKQISIIIPHYNSAEALGRLIDSIPEREEIEILVVDDNSTQDTQRLKEVTDTRPGQITLLYNELGKNSAGTCRNIGLSQARGKWLLFADADDYFVSDLWNAVSKYLDSEYDIVFFPPTSLDLRTGEVSDRHLTLARLALDYADRPDKRNEVNLRYLWAGPYSKLIRTSLVKQNRITFDETRVANDVMFSVKAACAAGKITVDKQVIYCITKNTGTLVMSKARKDIRTRVKVNVKKYCYLRRHAGREAFRILDFRISYYMCIIRRNAGTTRDYIWTWLYCAVHGVRPFLSRKWTVSYLMRRLAKKAD